MSHTYSKYIISQQAWRRNVAGLLKVLLLSWFFISCEKENLPPGTASLTIVNATVGSKPLATNFSIEGPVPYTTGKRLQYNSFSNNANQFNAYAGSQRLRLFQYPDTAAGDQPLFDLKLDLPVGSISTLFLTGTVSAPDTLFTRDAIPFFAGGDSAMAIRFVNLSPGSAPISINIIGLADGSEIASLSFKKSSEFRRYAVRDGINDYVFEFRDAESGNLLASYETTGINYKDPNWWIYRSFTLALIGGPGETGANTQKAFLISHY